MKKSKSDSRATEGRGSQAGKPAGQDSSFPNAQELLAMRDRWNESADRNPKNEAKKKSRTSRRSSKKKEKKPSLKGKSGVSPLAEQQTEFVTDDEEWKEGTVLVDSDAGELKKVPTQHVLRRRVKCFSSSMPRSSSTEKLDKDKGALALGQDKNAQRRPVSSFHFINDAGCQNADADASLGFSSPKHLEGHRTGMRRKVSSPKSCKKRDSKEANISGLFANAMTKEQSIQSETNNTPSRFVRRQRASFFRTLTQQEVVDPTSEQEAYYNESCCGVTYFCTKRAFSLRCWMLVPLVIILVVVAFLTTILADVTATRNSRNALSSLHDLVTANMEISVGRQTLSKMVRLLSATGSMYFSNNTFPDPQKDRLMPLDSGMMSRLCAALRDMDSEKTISTLGAVSLSRKKAVICIASRTRPGNYGGAVSENGIIRAISRVDPVTLEFMEPRKYYSHPLKQLDIATFTTSQHFDKVVNVWNESVIRGVPLKPSDHWVTPQSPPTYAAFVYPFFESYNNGEIGYGYLYATMFTHNLTSMRLYDAEHSGIRVMLVDPNAGMDRLLVIANNWNQPLSNVTHVWFATMLNQTIKYLYVDTIEDVLMKEAIKYVDLREAITQNTVETSRFAYAGSEGYVTAKPYTTPSGVEVVLVVATTTRYDLGPTKWYRNTALALQIIVVLIVIVACIAFVECCLIRPLRVTKNELKRALLGVRSNKWIHTRIVLREVNELNEVCDTLRRRLQEVHTYMPHRLMAEGRDKKSKSRTSIKYGQNLCRSSEVNQVRSVTCTVVYVYYCPIVTTNPSNRMVEMMMNVVVATAAEFRGCLEVQRPDFCVISFGVQSAGREASADALMAVRFAQRLHSEFVKSDELAGQYRIIVESGSFLSGVISAGGRSHFVLLCRNLHHKVGNFLVHAGVTAAVTEETALLVRGRRRLLPFETIYLSMSDDTQVQLYEVLLGDARKESWYAFEQSYCEAYDRMLRGDYSAAQRWWTKAKTIEETQLEDEHESSKSSQLNRLMAECAARIEVGNAALYVHRPCGKLNNVDYYSLSESSGSKTLSPILSPHESSRRSQCTVDASELLSVAQTSDAFPRHFTDTLGNLWRRAMKPFSEDTIGDVTPVYMGISATGTLAVLKVCPLTDAAGRAPRGAVDAALERLVGVEQNDSLVPYLSFCHAAPHGVVLVTEYVPGGTLRETTARYGRRLPLPAVRRNVVSILRGLSDLHGRGLVHGRVCPENVMMGVEGRCRLKGMLLGAAPLLVHHDSYYASPEEAAGGAKTAAGDMYALGLLLLEMLTNRPPWQWAPGPAAEQSAKALDALLADCVRFREALRDGRVVPMAPPDDTDEAMRGVIEACLQTHPNDRAGAEVLLRKLKC